MADPTLIDGRGVVGGPAQPVAIMNQTMPGVGQGTGGATKVEGVTGGTPLAVTQAGAAHTATGQVATSTSAGTLLAARATRRSATFVNMDTSITVYIGPATVSAANGLRLKAGESINIASVDALQVIAASGTPTVNYVELYD